MSGEMGSGHLITEFVSVRFMQNPGRETLCDIRSPLNG